LFRLGSPPSLDAWRFGFEIEALMPQPSLLGILILLASVIAAYLACLAVMNGFARESGVAEGRQRFWLRFQIFFLAPVFIYVTVEALLFTYFMWFGQAYVRE
jgi:hypothetical protein